MLNAAQLEKIVALRRRLHACPERSGHETATSAAIRAFLEENTSLAVENRYYREHGNHAAYIVIAGDKAGSKYDKALQLGIQLMDEESFAAELDRLGILK